MQGKIAVLGAGAWGVALSSMLAHSGHTVALWARTADVSEEINLRHESVRLPGVPLCRALKAYTDAALVLSGAEAVVSAIVSDRLRGFLRETEPFWPNNVYVLSATKGLELDTCKRMTQVLSDELPRLPEGRLAALSGPNLAGEIAWGKPASTVVASRDEDTAHFFQKLLHSDSFRVYTNSDVVGIELGGAIKNVIAIAAGMCSGLGLGENVVAALATRGIAEIKRLGEKLGACTETFSGMAGFGDIIVTCCSSSSRNRSLGEAIGRGKPPELALRARKTVAEGVHTVQALNKLACDLSVSLPISEIVYRVLFENLPAGEAVGALMGRDAKKE